MTVRVMEGHVLDVLRSLPSNTFQCAATSPPYYGLRDYGLPPQVWGGESGHEHEWGRTLPPKSGGAGNHPDRPSGFQQRSAAAQSGALSQFGTSTANSGRFCACGAWLGSLGLEPTPELYVEHLVSVFREVRRTLRPDGVCWVNLGDSYAGSGKGPSNSLQPLASQPGAQREMSDDEHDRLLREAMDADMERADQKRRQGFDKSDSNRGSLKYSPLGGVVPSGCKPKDLLGMPWMVAFALRADGWYLRAEIIWSKPNPMPESVTDRPTKAHETVFLLAKSRTYFYDADAIREPATYAGKIVTLGEKSLSRGQANGAGIEPSGNGRAESVVVAAGRNKRSVWEIATAPFPEAHFATFPPNLVEPMLLAGSRPGDHVLDPFGGAGTTGLVADRLGRDCTLIELNPGYASMARERIASDAPLFVDVA